jgi:hypothetical protein
MCSEVENHLSIFFTLEKAILGGREGGRKREREEEEYEGGRRREREERERKRQKEGDKQHMHTHMHTHTHMPYCPCSPWLPAFLSHLESVIPWLWAKPLLPAGGIKIWDCQLGHR